MSVIEMFVLGVAVPSISVPNCGVARKQKLCQFFFKKIYHFLNLAQVLIDASHSLQIIISRLPQVYII
jgi:hypothetical protein